MNPRFLFIFAALVLLGLTGCGSDSTSTPGSGFGDLTVYLTDAPSPEYKAVYVSVNQVEVKRSADDDDTGWQVVDIVNETINLLDLSGGRLKSLGTGNLPAGEYNQLRLRLAEAPDDEENLNGEGHPFAHYVILADDTEEELTVPSGYQSGIKLVKQFTIASLGTTELILDFDAMKSVVQAGASGKWLLKPVIKVLDTVTMAQIEGTVRDASDDSIISSARITAQTFDSTATGLSRQITIHAGTLSAVDGDPGAYVLRVPEGIYTLVVYKDGFRPECQRISTTSGETYTENFALSAASPPGTLRVTISGLTETDDSVTISVRKSGLCGGSLSTLYEMTSQSFASNGDFEISLPPGPYTVVAYDDNRTIRSASWTLNSGQTKILKVSL